MSVPFTVFHSFVEALAEKKHDLGSDTLKWMLTNSAPSTANTQKSDITEISAGNGYTAGGHQATQVSSAQSAGLYKLVVNDTVITAAGGDIGPARYAVLYNDTAAGDLLIGWYDYGAAFTIHNGETFTVDNSAINGILQLQIL